MKDFRVIARRWVQFEGTTWPMPEHDEDDSLEWKLRYGTPTKQDLLVAASYLNAYGCLVRATDKKRAEVVRNLKAALTQSQKDKVE